MMVDPSQLLFQNAQALELCDVSHEKWTVYQHTWTHGVANTTCQWLVYNQGG